jgi:RNA polymerase sigma factor (TIGR02999 family)
MTDRPAFTQLLEAVAAGDRAAHQQVFEAAYAELKRIARGSLKRAGGAVTINPSALVNEAWIKFAGSDRALANSQHFYSVLAQAMRQIVLDSLKAAGTGKRGKGQARTELSENLEKAEMPLEELLAIDAALRDLEACDPELAQLVEWHFFAGLSFVEIAQLRGANERTVRRHWEMARAFLLKAMTPA